MFDKEGVKIMGQGCLFVLAIIAFAFAMVCGLIYCLGGFKTYPVYDVDIHVISISSNGSFEYTQLFAETEPGKGYLVNPGLNLHVGCSYKVREANNTIIAITQEKGCSQ